ncbi:hypothetical protein SAMN05421690_101235 [Nitrosomonas sp. Nm51]|uniref:hypothetical protein n=1 Tax=Nitrosomonas sp. Nm51 TaxID=133720 RepID=UPI0008C34582|nr:hypothetical protein [Nitrosomonas sp. Nm51]SER20034.1 hypothetical protein SAMN05421690_101235 [Nitrosomonas sp. Nm51]
MANSSNALWIGGIVIVAALTVVELLSSRENNDAAESVDTATATSSASVSAQQDAGRIAMGPAETQGFADVPDTEFNIDTEFAPDLIIDLDNPEANAAGSTENLSHMPKAETAESEAAMSDRGADANTSGDEAVNSDTVAAETGTADAESTAPAPVDTAVAQHLAAAEKALKDFRMTTPPGDNAYEHYQTVLTIESGNAEALAGIQKMVDMYIHLAEKAIADGKKNNARVYLQRAEKLAPGSLKLKNLRTGLD